MGANGGRVVHPLRPGRKCWAVWRYPAQGYEVQTWVKPQPGGAMAVLMVNSNTTAAAKVRLQLSALNMTAGKVRVRDIWAHSDNGTASGVLEAEVPPADSHFLLLRPAS